MGRNWAVVTLGCLGLLVFVSGGCPLVITPGESDTLTGGASEARSCWDLNDDGIGQPEEDRNDDGDFDALDCVAQDGERGPTGPAGTDGLSCWDLDGDGTADPEEDVNEDGAYNALDCVGPAGPAGPAGADGAAGEDGEDGADGAPGGWATYGDGSAGPKVFAVSATLADANLFYTNFTIEAGVTLTVPSGTVIRCTGTFRNDGAIVVQNGARGGTQTATSPSMDPAYAPAHPGVATSPASNGEYGNNTQTRAGGIGGVAIGSWAARFVLLPGAMAGGGGGGAMASVGGAGGGSLVIVAQSAIYNPGTITANGAAGPVRCGGGAGGVVVLASPGAVVNTGSINANGGTGGNSDGSGGVGGGGGGGIVHFLGPVQVPGTVNVLGGAAGAVVGNVTADPRQGGGGGGACGGNGGAGGSVSAGGVSAAATAGSAGQFLQSTVDPGGRL